MPVFHLTVVFFWATNPSTHNYYSHCAVMGNYIPAYLDGIRWGESGHRANAD